MNKTNIKRILAALTALACGAVLTGCGGGKDSSNTGSAGSSGGSASVPAAPVTLKVWESVDGPDKWIAQAGAAFHEKHPDITVEFVNVELGDTVTNIAMDGPAGTGPDLFAAPHDKLGELVVGGHALATANADAVRGKVLASCADALTYDGTMYGYPTSSETYALIYNKALISTDEVPKTWDELIAWCKTFQAKNTGKRGFVMDVTSCYYSIIFTTANGNRLFGESGTDTSSSYLATPDAVAGMRQFRALREILPVAAADMGLDIADGAFESGAAAMHLSGPWNISRFADAGIDFGVTTLPAFAAGGEPAASFSGTRGMFVSAYSTHPTEAALFADFLISPEMQELRYEITGALPAVECELRGDYAAYSDGFVAQLKYAFPMPSVPQMSAFWDAAAAATANIWDGADVEKELGALDTAILGSVGQ